MWSDLGWSPPFHQWELLHYNGHGPSVLCVWSGPYFPTSSRMRLMFAENMEEWFLEWSWVVERWSWVLQSIGWGQPCRKQSANGALGVHNGVMESWQRWISTGAPSQGNVGGMWGLIARGVAVDGDADSRHTPLHYAAHHGHVHTCWLFVQVFEFVGAVCRTETMHQLLCFKSKFPNHFAFTLGCYLFLLFWVYFMSCGCEL